MEKLKTLAQFINESGSVAEAGRRLSIEASTLRRWQKNKSKPSQSMVKLARLKGVDLENQLLLPEAVDC